MNLPILSLSVFETTIRYVRMLVSPSDSPNVKLYLQMGGLLSAYELSGGNDERLLLKAQEIGDLMSFAWIDVCPLYAPLLKSLTQCHQDNDIPYGHLDFSTIPPKPDYNQGTVSFGT